MMTILIPWDTNRILFSDILDYLEDNDILFHVGNNLQIDFENNEDMLVFKLKFIYEYGKEDEI